jgi:hypothetical protein
VDGVAVASIITSGVVGLAGVGIPAIVRRGDRKHEEQTYVRDRRVEAYTRAVSIVYRIPESANEPLFDELLAAGVGVTLWASEDVRRGYVDWVSSEERAHSGDATDEDRQRATAAGNAVMRLMAHEVQAQRTLKRKKAPAPPSVDVGARETGGVVA